VEHRRSDRRYERRLPIEILYEGATHAGHTRNISLGGVFIELDHPLPFGARIKLRFKVPTQPEAVDADGQVRWLEMEEGRLRGIGVRFDGLRARDVWAINKFIERPLEEEQK
jgi:uncharacterized protein (TIGR02266 family)